MKYYFPYLQRDGQFYPIVEVEVAGPRDTLSIGALVDSGATFSVIRSDVADVLGIKIEKGSKIYLEGVGGRILGYRHLIQARIVNRPFKLKVVFSPELNISFSLLGRDNFFQQFRIAFDEEKKITILQTY